MTDNNGKALREAKAVGMPFGLPMRRVNAGFRDVVTGRMVYRFMDTKGRLWLAHHRWDLLGRFRVLAVGEERND